MIKKIIKFRSNKKAEKKVLKCGAGWPNCSDNMNIAILAGEYEEDTLNYWRALVAVIKFNLRDSDYGGGFCAFRHNIGCLISLIFNRKCKEDGYYAAIASWGHTSLYGGWEAMFIDYNPKTFRYHIYSDGDWNM